MVDLFDALLSYKTDLKIRPKKVWAHHNKPSKDAFPKIPVELPVSFVYCSFTPSYPGGKQRDYLTALGPRPRTVKVLQVLKSLQAQDQKKLHHDIRYNFMIGGDGVVYEGRGWGLRPGLPIRHFYNINNSIHIGFVGYWYDEPPDQKLFDLRDELIRIGMHKRIIKSKHLLVTLSFPCAYRFNFGSYVK